MSQAAQRPLLTAFALSLGAAISLGLARFSYALLLPPMRADLDWSYLLAGAMNTSNALGYFIGALLTPTLMRRFGAQAVLFGGALLTVVFLLAAGWLTDANLLLAQRLLSGVGSALIFIAGGLLAARLGALHPQRAGLLIGLYYGGTGIGIVLSAALVPLALAASAAAGSAHGWQWASLGLGALSLLATAGMALAARHLDGAAVPMSAAQRPRVATLAYGLSAYLMFGVGYIGYMTFVVALLKEQGMVDLQVNLFYGALGLALMASPRIWAGLLDRSKGGQAIATLNGLLGVATLIPVLTAATPLVFLSGILFGAVFLSVVASTTALV